MSKRFGMGLTGALLATLALGAGNAGAAGLDDRDSEPVVITGDAAPKLIGIEPGEVVAFTYDDGWRQIPVQVDERKMLDYRPIRQRSASEAEFRAIGYADPDTWAEADGVPQTETASPRGSGQPIPGTTGDPMLDGNDEIAMMAWDAGSTAADAPNPVGVAGTTRTPVKVTDPLDPDNSRFIYLFRATGSLDQSADTDLVSYEQTYDPELEAGYREDYNFNSIGDDIAGPPVNPEDSVVTTGRYEIGIPARWMIDRLVIAAADEPDVDILDGDKSTVSPNGCGRNELTFSRGGGGFIANIDGPVRAIRSFIGANSGTFTQREYVFYEGLFENRTVLRVHPGINQFVTAMDLSEESIGMTYRNELNPTGVPVDGVQDSPVAGAFDWEQFAGPQGSITNVARLETSIAGVTQSSYYQDMATPPTNSSMRCSGDDHSYGAAGSLITTLFNNSDPTLAPDYPELPVSTFASVRYSWFDGPEADAALGALRSEQVDNPLEVTTGNVVDPPDPEELEPARLKLIVSPSRVRLKQGRGDTLLVTVLNTGEKTASNVKICPRRARWKLAPTGCRKVKRLAGGDIAVRFFTVRVRRSARPGRRQLWIKARAKDARSGGAGVRVIIRRR